MKLARDRPWPIRVVDTLVADRLPSCPGVGRCSFHSDHVGVHRHLEDHLVEHRFLGSWRAVNTDIYSVENRNEGKDAVGRGREVVT